MVTGLEAILLQIFALQTVDTLDQLTRLVLAHPDYKGHSTERNLRIRIKHILENEDFQNQLKEEQRNSVSLGLKLGRLEIKGKLDLS